MADWQDLIDLEVLASWMDGQGLGAGPIEDAHILGGGTQNILLHFLRDNRPYVLRRPPPHLRANSNETMRREMRVLGALAGSDVPHPGLIAGCPEEDVLGASFYLMEPIDGFNPTTGMPDYHRSDPVVRHRMGLSFVEAIAALGAVDYLAVGLDGLGKPENFLSRQVGRWQKHLDSYEAFDGWPGRAALPDVDKIANWLDRHCPQDFRPGIIHGDYHMANVMFCNDSPELAAAVDWELTTIGDPLIDLGWVLATWPDPEGGVELGVVRVEPSDGFPTPKELITHYAARSERDMSHMDWYEVLACYKLGIVIEGTFARAHGGKAPMEVGQRLHDGCVGLLTKALTIIR